MKNLFIEILSSFFYIGYLPASGTFATVASFFLVVLLYQLNIFFRIFIILFFIISGIYFSGSAESIFKNKDDKRIVIDEIVGFLIAMLGFYPTFLNLILCFLLFRFFDISKFFVLNKLQKLPYGVGIMFDDILAGFFANVILKFILFFF
ncbi:MAG: phosphatidylglycerophosphatase A [Endomicrobiia bacterium]